MMPGPIGYITGRLARLLRIERVRIRGADGEADADTAVPAGERTALRAVLPREMEGAYRWSTGSEKLTLEDADRETVTVIAGDEVSGRGGERIELHFRADDGSFESRTRLNINVIKVEFERATDPVYGHDEMDGDESLDHHLSIQKNDFGFAWVSVTGGADGRVLRFTTEDDSVAEVREDDIPARPGTHFLQVVRGKNTNKGETEIKVRTFRDDGPVAAVLKVNVYRKKSESVTIAKVIDSESEDTALSRPDSDMLEGEEVINGWYGECVGEIEVTEEMDEDSETMDIRYDLNGNGALDLEPGATSAEQRAIMNEFNPAGQKVVVVKDLNWIYFLREAASAGDESINLKSSYSSMRGGSERGYMRFIVVGSSYTLGTGDSAEEITVDSRNGATVNLASSLENDHGTDEGIMWPLSGLSGNPIWVKEGTKTEEKVRQTIAHECGHSLFNWRDVDSATSLMHYSSGRTDTLLRFRELPKKYEEGDENQWDVVSR